MLPAAQTYETLAANFAWQIPERYNIGVDVCDKWADGSGRLALIYEQRDGSATRYSFDDLKARSNQFANALRRNGVPRTPADLAAHTCLHTVTTIFPAHEWVFQGPRGRETFAPGTARFCVNVAEALAVAVSEGMGIGLLPFYSAANGLRNGELVQILPEYTSQHTNVYAVYPSRQYLDAKIRTWVEFLRDELPLMLNHEYQEAVATADLLY